MPTQRRALTVQLRHELWIRRGAWAVLAVIGLAVGAGLRALGYLGGGTEKPMIVDGHYLNGSVIALVRIDAARWRAALDQGEAICTLPMGVERYRRLEALRQEYSEFSIRCQGDPAVKQRSVSL